MGLATCYYRQIEGELSNDWEEFICILDILKVLALPQPERFELCWRISLRHVANLDWLWLCFRWFSRGPFDPAPGPHLSIRFCPPPVLTQSWDRLAPSSPHRPLVLSPSSRRSLQRSKPHRHGCHSPSSCARVGVEATRPLKDRGALAARGIGVHRSPRRPISLPLVYPVAQSQRQKPRVCSSKSPTPHPPPQTSTSISPPPTLCSADDTSSSPSPVKKTRRFGSCGAHPVIMASVASSVAVALRAMCPIMSSFHAPLRLTLPAVRARRGTDGHYTNQDRQRIYKHGTFACNFSNHFLQACLLSSTLSAFFFWFPKYLQWIMQSLKYHVLSCRIAHIGLVIQEKC